MLDLYGGTSFAPSTLTRADFADSSQPDCGQFLLRRGLHAVVRPAEVIVQGPLATTLPTTTTRVLDRAALPSLVEALKKRGYDVIGPRAAGTAVIYGAIDSADDLPAGWIAEQDAGRYRLQRSHNGAAFAFGPAADSLKRYLNPPVSTVWRATRQNGALTFAPAPEPPAPLAVIGARPCDLEAVARYDEIFLKGPYVDPGYQARRASMFIVAANCTNPGGTCFCASMGTGPRASAHFDIALTELPAAKGSRPAEHRYLATSGSVQGAALLDTFEGAPAEAVDLALEEKLLKSAAGKMGRKVEMKGLPEVLAGAAEHPQWDDVAHRCLTCANCTMVCPTCFCSTVDDHTDLAGTEAERRRRWDSCFTTEFSYIHGGSIRPSARARYRQWLTHKFLYWAQQFGAPGCVGCGRCITWCPVGIDITREIEAIRTVRGSGLQP